MIVPYYGIKYSILILCITSDNTHSYTPFLLYMVQSDELLYVEGRLPGLY